MLKKVYKKPILIALILLFTMAIGCNISTIFNSISFYIVQIIRPLTMVRINSDLSNVNWGNNEIITDQEIQNILTKADTLQYSNLTQIQKHFLTNPWIKDVQIIKTIPNNIYIKIIEHQPYAIWFNGKNHYAINNKGQSVTQVNLREQKYSNLITIISSIEPIKAQLLIAMLQSKPKLLDATSTLEYIGNRRWDLTLNNGMTIKLPQTSLDPPLNYLSDNLDAIISQNLSVLDMRLPNKLYVVQK